MIAVLAATVVQAVSLQNLGKDVGKLCHTFYFILPNTVNQLINIVFIAIAVKISKTINEYNTGQMALIQDEDRDTVTEVQ